MPEPCKSCPQCGAPVSPGAPEGLCPRCVASLNLHTDTFVTGGADATAPVPAMDEIAAHFPQLEILEYLGRGGMGVVYKARQKTLGRLVALKLLAPERVSDPKFAGRFIQEAQALATMNHPNIVTIHDFGQAGGLYYLLMEYFAGVNLRQAMKAGRFSPEQALAIVPPVCEALQYAHENGIVHRDIKPENLLLDKTGRVKIADFGIAKMLGTDAPAVGLAESQPAGTPQYMAPEQRAGLQRADHRADIYSLGVVLYEMLTGELPGPQQMQAPSRRVQIDVRIDEIVLRALETRPELRFATAADFRTQIESVVKRPAHVAPPLGATTRKLPTTALAIVIFFAGLVLGIAFLEMLSLRRSSAHFFILVLMLLAAPMLAQFFSRSLHAAIRSPLAEQAATARGWLKTSSALGWLLSLPAIGLTAYFLLALLSDTNGWNPAGPESVVAPLVWLAVLMLPASSVLLWHAAQQPEPDRATGQGSTATRAALTAGIVVAMVLSSVLVFHAVRRRSMATAADQKAAAAALDAASKALTKKEWPAIVHGRLLDSNGRPLANQVLAFVDAGRHLRANEPGFIVDGVTAVDGTFQFELPRDRWWEAILVRRGHFDGPRTVALSTPNGGRTTSDAADYHLELRLTGNQLDARLAPVLERAEAPDAAPTTVAKPLAKEPAAKEPSMRKPTAKEPPSERPPTLPAPLPPDPPKPNQGLAMFSPVETKPGDMTYQLIANLVDARSVLLGEVAFVDERTSVSITMPHLSFTFASSNEGPVASCALSWSLQPGQDQRGEGDWKISFHGQHGAREVEQSIFVAGIQPFKDIPLQPDPPDRGPLLNLDPATVTWRHVPTTRSHWVGPGEWNPREWNRLTMLEVRDENGKTLGRLRLSLLLCPLDAEVPWARPILRQGSWEADEELRAVIEGKMPKRAGKPAQAQVLEGGLRLANRVGIYDIAPGLKLHIFERMRTPAQTPAIDGELRWDPPPEKKRPQTFEMSLSEDAPFAVVWQEGANVVWIRCGGAEGQVPRTRYLRKLIISAPGDVDEFLGEVRIGADGKVQLEPEDLRDIPEPVRQAFGQLGW